MEDLLTRPEVAERLRTSPETLANWAYQGFGPPYLRVGRKALYRKSDIEAWLEQQLAGKKAS